MTPEKYKKENKQIEQKSIEMLVPGRWVMICGGKFDLKNEADIPTPVVFETPEESLAYFKKQAAQHAYKDVRVIKRFICTPEGQNEQVDYEGYARDMTVHIWSVLKIEEHNVENIRAKYKSEARTLLSFWKWIETL